MRLDLPLLDMPQTLKSLCSCFDGVQGACHETLDQSGPPCLLSPRQCCSIYLLGGRSQLRPPVGACSKYGLKEGRNVALSLVRGVETGSKHVQSSADAGSLLPFSQSSTLRQSNLQCDFRDSAHEVQGHGAGGLPECRAPVLDLAPRKASTCHSRPHSESRPFGMLNWRCLVLVRRPRSRTWHTCSLSGRHNYRLARQGLDPRKAGELQEETTPPSWVPFAYDVWLFNLGGSFPRIIRTSSDLLISFSKAVAASPRWSRGRCGQDCKERL
ncbi:hypothetical protein K504DRAFT_6047 [Pleomassaria siparia CBS 279.74]|uniref:Uncharacterized protein n=1 Tax=Pleomassaria siparia CBS 279.74 TaxID=1314801 RepID=A0A6G1KPI5_9PLEO|nr:hypothetical protein K504DRAFT_6047 [Pleomassaria siparia CBS 279.74]